MKLKIGDLVRPRAYQFRDQMGVVIVIGWMGAIGVRLMDGRVRTYNKGALEIVSKVL